MWDCRFKMSLAKFSLAKFSESLANPKIKKNKYNKFSEPKISLANPEIPKISLANPKMSLAILNILNIFKNPKIWSLHQHFDNVAMDSMFRDHFKKKRLCHSLKAYENQQSPRMSQRLEDLKFRHDLAGRTRARAWAWTRAWAWSRVRARELESYVDG